MSQIDIIRAEIERLKGQMKGLQPYSDFQRGEVTALNEVIAVLDTIKEQPVCDGLEEAADAYVMSQDNFPADQREHLYAFNAFKAGWLACREQMMKEAVEGRIYGCDGLWVESRIDARIQGKEFDKVKLIIIKED